MSIIAGLPTLTLEVCAVAAIIQFLIVSVFTFSWIDPRVSNKILLLGFLYIRDNSPTNGFPTLSGTQFTFSTIEFWLIDTGKSLPVMQYTSLPLGVMVKFWSVLDSPAFRTCI